MAESAPGAKADMHPYGPCSTVFDSTDGPKLPITVQDASRRFLEDLDETVPQPTLERYMKAMGGFLEYLQDAGVAQVDQLESAHVEEYLLMGYPVEDADVTGVRDLWHVLNRFVKWLDRRKLSRVRRRFAMGRRVLRQKLNLRFEQTR